MFETQLDRSASEGQVSQKEHLLSEENIEEESVPKVHSSCLQCLFYIDSSVAQLVRAPH